MTSNSSAETSGSTRNATTVIWTASTKRSTARKTFPVTRFKGSDVRSLPITQLAGTSKNNSKNIRNLLWKKYAVATKRNDTTADEKRRSLRFSFHQPKSPIRAKGVKMRLYRRDV